MSAAARQRVNFMAQRPPFRRIASLSPSRERVNDRTDRPHIGRASFGAGWKSKYPSASSALDKLRSSPALSRAASRRDYPVSNQQTAPREIVRGFNKILDFRIAEW
ncbi:MAG: hypothetical protein ACM3O6_01535, partial [Acidobacteriota bacterium]